MRVWLIESVSVCCYRLLVVYAYFGLCEIVAGYGIVNFGCLCVCVRVGILVRFVSLRILCCFAGFTFVASMCVETGLCVYEFSQVLKKIIMKVVLDLCRFTSCDIGCVNFSPPLCSAGFLVNSFDVLSPWLEIVFVFFAGFMHLPPFLCVLLLFI